MASVAIEPAPEPRSGLNTIASGVVPPVRNWQNVPTVRVEDNRGWFCVVIEASSDADLSRIRTVIQSL